ncbi:disintegrin and metalloproteinase domain-containing protein 11-like isoform X4 [Arapaima gigas]
MLPLRCLLFAAVTGWGGSLGPAGQLGSPRRLVRRLRSGDEMLHSRLDTRLKSRSQGTQPIHLAHSSFLVEAFGSSFILDLELNHNLLSADYVERHFGEDGKPVETMGGEHCYYHGRLRDVPGSWAALSTCQGLHGVFSDGKFSYGIEPVLHSGPQVRRRTSGSAGGGGVKCRKPPPRRDTVTSCTRNGTGGREDGDRSPEVQQHTSSEGLRRSKRHVRRPQPTVQTETKYIELMVVNDHDLFTQLRKSTAQTKNFAKAVVNMADAMYKEQLNTRIVLVAMETWSSQNMVSVSDDPLVTLRDFMKYRKESIKERSDATHLLSGRTFQSSRSGTAYRGGICSLSRGGGVNEYGNVGPLAVTLCQSLGQNIGMMWNKDRAAAGDCRCPDPWLGCIMEDTGYYLPRKFARCSVDEYLRFLQQGGGSCLFNKPSRLLDPPECGNGFVETGEECDCGSPVVSQNTARLTHCSPLSTHGPWVGRSPNAPCRPRQYELRGAVCREAVNDCDVPETCTGDSSQCPHNVHKQDGYLCGNGQVTVCPRCVGARAPAPATNTLRVPQGRCYGGRCRTLDAQCGELWGHSSADRFCYEKLNTEGTETGNCGRDVAGRSWVPCSKQDVLCGLLLCANMTGKPKFGELQGEVTSQTIYHQSKYLDCRGGHAVLEDGSDVGYVEDGTPCGPNMMCLDHRCLPLSAFNLSSCPGSSPSSSRVCSYHGTCSNEGKCICERDFTGKDCSVYDPVPDPRPSEGPEKYKDLEGDKCVCCSVFLTLCPSRREEKQKVFHSFLHCGSSDRLLCLSSCSHLPVSSLVRFQPEPESCLPLGPLGTELPSSGAGVASS